jgi:hypothetical protein
MKKKITIELEPDEIGLLYKYCNRVIKTDIEAAFVGSWNDPLQLAKNVEITGGTFRKISGFIHNALPANAPELDY